MRLCENTHFVLWIVVLLEVLDLVPYLLPSLNQTTFHLGVMAIFGLISGVLIERYGARQNLKETATTEETGP